MHVHCTFFLRNCSIGLKIPRRGFLVSQKCFLNLEDTFHFPSIFLSPILVLGKRFKQKFLLLFRANELLRPSPLSISSCKPHLKEEKPDSGPKIAVRGFCLISNTMPGVNNGQTLEVQILEWTHYSSNFLKTPSSVLPFVTPHFYFFLVSDFRSLLLF